MARFHKKKIFFLISKYWKLVTREICIYKIFSKLAIREILCPQKFRPLKCYK